MYDLHNLFTSQDITTVNLYENIQCMWIVLGYHTSTRAFNIIFHKYLILIKKVMILVFMETNVLTIVQVLLTFIRVVRRVLET